MVTDIYKHIDIVSIRKLLINHPTLLILLELILTHINSIMNPNPNQILNRH